ncbi:tetratricopeptide repeat protein [Streptomyces sp. NPDC048290]|uniref:AfsR/SARP family transcriptional regulator n=1 Tax=Streptomyces sp. NPDC048290 TaxID=3155811 RepID=UPI003449BF6C
MDGRVLGPVSVMGEGGKRALGTSKTGGLFALLATSEGLRCERAEIAQVLWDGQSGVGQRVDQVVKELRKLVGGREVLPHAGKSGCLILRVPADSVDYLRFLQNWREADALPCPERFQRIRSALREWDADDEPLRGLSGEGFETRRDRMKAKRAEAVCDLLEAASQSRNVRWLREESANWYARLPAHMRVFQYYLMAHGNVTADGKRVSDEERERLIGQWVAKTGSAPDAELQDVIDQLRGGGPSRSGLAVLPPIPDQLTADAPVPVGQDDLIRDLVDYMAERQRAGRTAVILLSGMAGVGKSAVARHLARLVRDRFPDGVLRAHLNGFADNEMGPAEPEHILDRFLARLPPYSTAKDLAEKSADLCTAVSHRSLLMILDDAFSARQVIPLLPGSGTSAVIITSRLELGGLCAQTEVYSRRVELLSDAAAMEVLHQDVVEKDREKYDYEFRELVRLCGNLPLALTVVERDLRIRARSTMPRLVREMKKEWELLEELHRPEHEMSVQVALRCSTRTLSEGARLLLWQLGVHPGPSITWDAVMDMGAVSEGMRPERVLGELVAANLVMFQDDRYALHDLVRAFARHHLKPKALLENASLRAETIRLVLEHQLQNVRACDRMLDRQRALEPIGEPDGVTVAEPENLKQAMDYLDTEYPTIRRVIDLAYHERIQHYIWLLPMALVTYQWRRRLLDEAVTDLDRAREITEEAEAPAAERAMVYRMLAGTQWRLDKYQLAVAQLKRAVLLSESDDSRSGRLSLTRSLYTLAISQRKLGDETEAEANLRQALDLYQDMRDPVGEAAVLNGIGALHLDRGELGEALLRCSDALALVEGTTDHNGHADVQFTLAKVYVARGERERGIELYQKACDTYQEQESWPGEEKARNQFADVLVAAGDRPQAILELERVLVLREQMGGMDVQEIRERLEGLR